MPIYYPYLSDRYKSTFIDALVLFGFIALVSIVLSMFKNVPNEVRIACFALLFLYEPIGVSLGGTIGNYATKIRVRKNADPEKRISIFISLLRSAIKYSLGIISLLFIHANPKRRALHDIFSGTVVISLTHTYSDENNSVVVDEITDVPSTPEV